VLNPDGTPVYANKPALDYTGLTIEEVMAPDFRVRTFHPEDIARLHDERRKALLGVAPFKNEQRVRRKDGQYRWFLIQYNPLLDDQGWVIRWYATGTDIHDRVQTEERTRNENLALREQSIVTRCLRTLSAPRTRCIKCSARSTRWHLRIPQF
jgi:formate hydrogenlyase transcriptional activator